MRQQHAAPGESVRPRGVRHAEGGAAALAGPRAGAAAREAVGGPGARAVGLHAGAAGRAHMGPPRLVAEGPVRAGVGAAVRHGGAQGEPLV